MDDSAKVPDKNETEAAINSAEKRYRQARNMLAEYLVERSAKTSNQSDFPIAVRLHYKPFNPLAASGWPPQLIPSKYAARPCDRLQELE